MEVERKKGKQAEQAADGAVWSIKPLCPPWRMRKEREVSAHQGCCGQRKVSQDKLFWDLRSRSGLLLRSLLPCPRQTWAWHLNGGISHRLPAPRARLATTAAPWVSPALLGPASQASSVAMGPSFPMASWEMGPVALALQVPLGADLRRSLGRWEGSKLQGHHSDRSPRSPGPYRNWI